MAAAPSARDLAAFHAIYASPILAFLPFLALKSQKENVFPFEDENRTLILAFYLATLTYIAALATEFKLRVRDFECPDFITNIGHLSAPLASISLITVTFPYMGWALFLIWMAFFIKVSVDSYQEFLSLLGDAARSASNIQDKLFHRETKKLQENNNHRVSISATRTSNDSPV